MKKKLLFTSLALSMSLYANADAIDRAQARLIAQNLTCIDDASTDNVPLAPYYVFSRGEGKGYVIVSGDDATAPVIGYTDMGDFVEGQIPAPLQNMLDAWAEKIKKLQDGRTSDAKTNVNIEKIRRRLVVSSYKANWTDVPVLMSTHWHQSYPYNMLAPHRTDNNNQALTGCLATAASQIVYYFRKDNPTETLYNTPTYGYGGAPVTVSLPKGTPLRYDMMKTSGTGTAKQDSAVAVLMYAAGTSAWLTYGDGDGTATSGQNSNMGDAIRGQFALNNDCLYKSSYSQQGWETMVYNNLTSGRPLLYTGASDSQGGHAVVLDGYQASTGLYHFNFGWGGQGDGYYTIDDETGMNGFHSYQSALANITPKNQNYTARIIAPTLYERAVSTINVMVANNATLAQSKFYIYCSTSNSKPASPTGKDEATIVASGDSAILAFSYRPASSGKPVNIWLCDANGNVLDQTAAEVLPTKSSLTLNGISADVSATVTQSGKYSFRHLNNTTANIRVSLTNGEDGTLCQPALRCSMYEYDTESQTWSSDSTVKAINTLKFDVGETRDTIFQFRNLKAGSYYKVHLVPVATTSAKDAISITTPDSVVYFRVFEPTLKVDVKGRNASVTGLWSPTLFAQAATDTYATSYDMTSVEGIASQPEAANKNAVFYAKAESEGLANVITDGECDSLVVCQGYDFLPKGKFHARKAIFIPADTERGKWGAIALPFAAKAPQGVQMRKITGITSSKFNTAHATDIAAATPFTFLPSTPHFKGFAAADADIAADSLYITHNDSLVVRTTSATATGVMMTLGEKSNLPYFLVADEGANVASFALILNANIKNGIRLFGDTNFDRAYTMLADSLYSAHIALDTHPGNSQCKQFADSIAAYTQAFDTYAFGDFRNVTASAKQLGSLIEKFLAEELPTGIEEIKDSSLTGKSDGIIRYYSIDGTPLSSPRRGIIIMRQGSMTRRIMVK